MDAPPARLAVEFNAALEISAITFIGCWFRLVVTLGLRPTRRLKHPANSVLAGGVTND